jgi:putative copper resistance protein D
MLARISAGGAAREEFEEKDFPRAAETPAEDTPEPPEGPVLDLRSRRKR